MDAQQQPPKDKATVAAHDSTRHPVPLAPAVTSAGASAALGDADAKPVEGELSATLADLANDLAIIDDLDSLCSLTAERAAALVGADEGTVYLDTRPLSTDDVHLQLTLPLRIREQVLGILTVTRHDPAAKGFSPEDERRLTLLASIAALAVAGLKREQAIRRRSDWRDRALDLLQETGRVMGSTLELVPLMRRIIDVTVHALNAEAGMLALLDSNGHLVLRAVAGAIPHTIVGTPLETEQSIIGWVARHGRSALVPDPSADPRASLEHPAVEAGFVAHALLAAPLVTKGRTIGAIEVANKRDGAFDQGDQLLLEALALSAGAAIENARLYELIQRQVLQQENIMRVGQAMSSAQDVDAVLQKVVDSAIAVIPVAFTATVHLLDEEQGLLRLHCNAGRPLWDTMKEPFPIGQGIAGYVFATRQLANVADVSADPRYVPGPGRVVYRSLLVAPLIVEDKPLGTLSVTGLEPNAFDRDDEQMIDGLAAQAAVGLRNARLLDSLRDSEARYRGLVENVNALLVIADAAGIITFVGGRWVEMMGYEPDEVIGLPYQHFCHPEDRPALAEQAATLRTAHSKISDVRYRVFHKDGTIRWHQASAVSTGTPDGQVGRIYIVAHDVTARVEAEQAIARHADELTALNTIASSIGHSLDIDDIVRGGLQELMAVLDLNVAGLTLIDADQDRMIPQTVIGLSPESLDFVVPLYRVERSQVVRTRQPVVIPDLMTDPRSARYPGLREMIEREGVRNLAIVPVTAQDELMGALFVSARTADTFSSSALDLLVAVGQQFGVALHNAQLYAQAEERAVQLEADFRQLQNLAQRNIQFVQNISHELRTPLTFVRGYLELLLGGELGALSEEQQKALDIMDVRSWKLANLVNDIASLLEIELSPTDAEPVDLADVVARSVMTQRERANQAGIVLETEWPDALPVVKGSQQRLKQVFYHLLDNAIKFSPDGGLVRVRVWSEGDSAFIQVADQGIGIPPEEQERIFDRFYQIDGSTTRRYSGTGLGLTIVKETIEAHRGTVQVESSGVPNEGSVFTVILPLLKQSP